MDPIRPIARRDRAVQPVELSRLRPLDREEERRERERRRRQQSAAAPVKRPEGGGDGIDVRA
jgi:hypothetical protein